MAATGNSCFWLANFFLIFSFASVVAMFVNRSGQNEQSLERTFHSCFLPSFSSFQRRRLKCEKLTTDDEWQTPSDGKSSHCLWQGELIKSKFENK
jgi:hypothetical protein